MKRDAKHRSQEAGKASLALFVRPTTPRSVGTKGTASNAYAFTLHERAKRIGTFSHHNYNRKKGNCQVGKITILFKANPHFLLIMPQERNGKGKAWWIFSSLFFPKSLDNA